MKTIEQIWNSWSNQERKDFVLTHLGADTPMQRISASVDSISAYSVISRATKRELLKHFNTTAQ